MTIPEHLRKFYEPNPNDDEKTKNFKEFILNREKTDREITEQQRGNNDKSKDIYNELKKMRGKTPIEQLEREYFINELLNK